MITLNASAWLAPTLVLVLTHTAVAQIEVLPTLLTEPAALAAVVTDYEAIVVRVPEEIELDLSAIKGAAVPFMLYLAEPILYRTGGVAIAADCPIEARLVPADAGIQIVTEAILVNGQLIPLQATSATVPPSRIETPAAAPPPRSNLQLVSLGSSVGSLLGGSERDATEGAMVGQVAEVLLNLIEPSRNNDRAIVTLTPGRQYILRLTPSSL
ncbi:MAG: hypothetical protein HC886_11960 [Leptolyngbyaceae cyanobacterium SM1_1_3]|nr:hypothetical protein [Leptolyngbyaceae cyanobacterium SM1_1_3]NJN03384.1 hypothetical protein [Leptolyngbyaceae cyanobacterium RM1_1_2]NJO10439.1 hypothetical protein [Leptolyngbyaceae cyanobacterium SL_1_1]